MTACAFKLQQQGTVGEQAGHYSLLITCKGLTFPGLEVCDGHHGSQADALEPLVEGQGDEDVPA